MLPAIAVENSPFHHRPRFKVPQTAFWSPLMMPHEKIQDQSGTVKQVQNLA
jgi:hypothetical protein